MVQEYICKIKGDTTELSKALSKVKGSMKELSDDEVLIKLDYDGNIQGFNKVFDSILKQCPDLTIQFQYDANQKLLNKELAKLNQLNDLKIDIETGNAEKKISSLFSDLKSFAEKDTSNDVIEAKIKSIYKYANTLSGLGVELSNTIEEGIYDAVYGTKFEDLFNKILDEVDLSKYKLFDFNFASDIDDEIKKTESNIDEFKSFLEKLESKGAVKTGVSSELQEVQEEIKILRSDLSDMKTELGNISGEKFNKLSEDIKDVNVQLQEALDKLARLSGDSTIDNVISNWNKQDITKTNERYTAFDSSSLKTSGEHLAANATGVSEELIRKSIEEMAGSADGFIHTHPEKFAAFSDSDLEAFFKLFDEGITKQIIASSDEIMSLDLSNINMSYKDEIISHIKERFLEIENNDVYEDNISQYLEILKRNIEIALSNSNTKNFPTEIVNNFRKNYNNILESLGNSFTGNDLFDGMETAIRQTLQESKSYTDASDELKKKIRIGLQEITPDLLGSVNDYFKDAQQLHFQKELISVFSDSKYLKDGVETAIGLQNIDSFKEDAKKGFIQIGNGIAEGMEIGLGKIDISKTKESVKTAVEEMVDVAKKATADAQDSHSPSLVAEKLGEYWPEGYAQGILKHKDDVENAIRELVQSGIITAQQILDDMPNIFGNLDYKDLINPVRNILSENFDSTGKLINENDISLVTKSNIEEQKNLENAVESTNEALKEQDALLSNETPVSSSEKLDIVDTKEVEESNELYESLLKIKSVIDDLTSDDNYDLLGFSSLNEVLPLIGQLQKLDLSSIGKFDVSLKNITNDILDAIELGKKVYSGEINPDEWENTHGQPIDVRAIEAIDDLADLMDRIVEKAETFKTTIEEVKTPSSIKDFYENYGTPSDALDKGYFGDMSEVIDELGGKFKELNNEKDLFSETKINTAFLKELSEELGITGDEAKVLFSEFENIDMYTSNLGQKMSGEQGAFSNAVKSVEKIKSILDGTYIITDEDVVNAENLLRVIRETENEKNNNADIVSRENLEQTESELNIVNEKLSETENALEDSRKYAESLEQQLSESTNKAKELADAMERIDRLQDQLQEERNYSSNAFDAQIVAETKNDELQKENDKLEEEISRLNNELANKQNIELSNKEVDASVNDNLREEKQLLEDLGVELNNVIQKVQEKTSEFENERIAVSQVIDDEINALKELENQLDLIITKASNIDIHIDIPESINSNINLGVDNLDPQIDKLKESVDNIKEILSALQDFKLGDASKLGTLFKNLSSVEWSKIKIPKSFVENLGNLVTGTAYLDKDNLNKLKNFLNAIVKIDLSTVGKNLNSVADGLSAIINQIKDTDTISALSDLKDTIEVLNKTEKLKDISKTKTVNTKPKKTEEEKEIDNKISQLEKIKNHINNLSLQSQGGLKPIDEKGLQKAEDTIKEIDSYIEDLKENNIDIISQEDLNLLKLAKSEIEKTYKIADGKTIDSLADRITKALVNNTKYTEEAKKKLREWNDELQNSKGSITVSRIKQISDAFGDLAVQERLAGNEGMSFFTKIKKQLSFQWAQAIARYFSLYDIIRYARELASTVTEIDTALTELRKVSDASTERLSQSFKKSAETAKELGSTITDVINATSDWSRMGYDISDAEELARVATLFQNVGDNMTADSANSYLISTLQGFQMSADQAEEIVDKYNEVANHFAIDTAGIGEALQRSAASLNAANTDLSKSIALVTTANITQQNPEVVGTAFKTLSARIRGAKTELEDLGEEEDEFTQTTSKLRDLVMSLTGFDIMEDEDTYKDIYEIMVGIGKEWDHLSDIEQQSLAESLAGKRNANVFYSVMNHIDDLEKAYQTAENSAGKIYYLCVQKCA